MVGFYIAYDGEVAPLLMLLIGACSLDSGALAGDALPDGAATEAGMDTEPPRFDSGAADAAPDAMDAEPDAMDAAPDAMDAAPDAMDATPDAMDAAPDAMDAAPDAMDATPDAVADTGGDTRVPFPGTALTFDGSDDFVRINRSVADDFTLEAWIRTTTSRSGSQHYEGLGIIYADVAGGNDDFGTAVLDDRFAFGVGRPDETIVSTTVITTGDWVHVAATRDRSTGEISIYVDGVREANLAASNRDALDARSTIEIGGNLIDDRFFSGTIDEVRIWDVVRTGAEIRAAMNLSLSGTEPGLVGYYRFDDGSGMTAVDSSPTMNDGSLGAGAGSESPAWITSTAPIVR